MTADGDYVTETEGAAMVTAHVPYSTGPRALPVGYTSRPGTAGVIILGAAVSVTAAFWAWCWARDVIRGVMGPC